MDVRRFVIATAVGSVIVTGVVTIGGNGSDDPRASVAPSTVHDSTQKPTTTTSTTTTTAPPTTTTTTPPPPKAPTVIAPLTGLPVPATDLLRPALVTKIDGSLPALPQEGLEVADIVYEVAVEWGSRYLAVWHSRMPDRIGPIRSARTTDINLLAMFGHPVFTYSGSNPGVAAQLAAVGWKTDVPPGRLPGAFERVSGRPGAQTLFAHPSELWKVPTPGVAPVPLFDYHPAGGPVVGIPVTGVTADPGLLIDFRYDPSLAGWRRIAWMQDHITASGVPVAPTNVVVLQMPYRQSVVDERSPQALSIGMGRAWAFTRGMVREGHWARANPFERWNLRDANGAPITLDPGQTWVVMTEQPPEIR